MTNLELALLPALCTDCGRSIVGLGYHDCEAPELDDVNENDAARLVLADRAHQQRRARIVLRHAAIRRS